MVPNRYVCIAVGGAAVVVLTLLLGTRDYNGAGTQVIERAMAGEASYAAFFIKLVMTAITIGVGYKGGEIVPRAVHRLDVRRGLRRPVRPRRIVRRPVSAWYPCSAA